LTKSQASTTSLLPSTKPSTTFLLRSVLHSITPLGTWTDGVRGDCDRLGVVRKGSYPGGKSDHCTLGSLSLADSLPGDTWRESGKQADVEEDGLPIEANRHHVLVKHLKRNVCFGPIFFRFYRLLSITNVTKPLGFSRWPTSTKRFGNVNIWSRVINDCLK
jgi:hypothetical protein